MIDGRVAGKKTGQTAHVRRYHRDYDESTCEDRFKTFPIQQDEHLLMVARRYPDVIRDEPGRRDAVDVRGEQKGLRAHPRSFMLSRPRRPWWTRQSGLCR